MTPPLICPGCGLGSDGRHALCGVCWSGVPGKLRAAIKRAQKAVGYNPASAKARAELDMAIAAATGALR